MSDPTHTSHPEAKPRDLFVHWIPFLTLVRREISRFLLMKSMTIFPQLITAVLYIIIFGYSLGGRIREIQGYPYIEFIFPGLVLMAVILSSYNNASTALFVARYDSSIQDILLTPLSYVQMVMAFTVASVIRGFLVGFLVLIVGDLMLHIPLYSWALTLLFFALTTLVFSSFGIIIGLWAERWEDVGLFINYIVTPLIFLGGIFYSIDMLPAFGKTISLLNPIFYMVNGFRYGILGHQEFPILLTFTIILLMAISMFATAVYLFRVGYKLKT